MADYDQYQYFFLEEKVSKFRIEKSKGRGGRGAEGLAYNAFANLKNYYWT